jgi:FkbM family methyltransferase
LARIADLVCVGEVFSSGQYSCFKDRSYDGLLDIGANIGAASVYFSLFHPKATIVACEPDPQNLVLLKANLAIQPSSTLFNAAAASTPGRLRFFTNSNRGQSSSIYNREGGSVMEVEAVPVRELLRPLSNCQKILVKCDIEGAEFDLFQQEPLSSAYDAVVEFHSDLCGRSLEDFLGLFSHSIKSSIQIAPNRYIVFISDRSRQSAISQGQSA